MVASSSLNASRVTFVSLYAEKFADLLACFSCSI